MCLSDIDSIYCNFHILVSNHVNDTDISEVEYKFSLIEGNELACKEAEGPPNECLDYIDIPLKCLHDVSPSVFDLGRMESDGNIEETDLQQHLLGFLYK